MMTMRGAPKSIGSGEAEGLGSKAFPTATKHNSAAAVDANFERGV